MGQLQTTAQAVARVTPCTLPEDVALADAAALLRTLDVLNGALLTRLADVDLRRLHHLDGSPSITTWVKAQATSVPATHLTLARRLGRFPSLADAITAGLLPVQAASRLGTALSTLTRHLDQPDGLIDGQPGHDTLTAVITDGVRGLLCRAWGGLDDTDPRLAQITAELREIANSPTTQLARIEAALVLLATHLPPTDLPHGLHQLLDALLPNELEKRAARGHDQARVTLTRNTDGSGWHLTEGQLDLECGELLHTILTAMSSVDPDNPTDTAAWDTLRAQGWHDGDPLEPVLPQAGLFEPDPTDPAGPGSCQPGVPRTRAQQTHDALKAALRLLVDNGLMGSRDKVTPHLVVTLGIDTLHATPGALPATAGSGTSLPLSLVQQWWCTSTLTRMIFSLGRRVIETSHTARTLKGHERRAKHTETGGRCQGAGCTRGSGCRLIPHHVIAYATCGTTSLTDTVLLCEQTHTQLHQGKTIRLKDGRRLNQHGWVT